MTLTILSDEQVNTIFENLNLDDLDEFRSVLASALHEFSTNVKAPMEFQQPRGVTTIHPDTQVKTSYMSSCVVSRLNPDIAKDQHVKYIPPSGVLSLFKPDGSLLGLVNPKALTAFRTALASACLLSRRNHVKTITVFGSGMQAYWHVRLALMMRGSTIKHVNVINRSFSDNAAGLLKRFAVIPHKQREGWAETQFGLLTPTFHEYNRLIKEQIREADVIYCCTPSQEPLFDGSILTSHEGRKKGRLIIAVGSHGPHMRELPDELIQMAVKQHEKPHRHFHKHAIDGGVIVVDNLEGVIKDAGEIILGKVDPNHLVELGELVMLHRLALEKSDAEVASSQASISSGLDSLDLESKSPSMSSVFNNTTSPRSSSPPGSVGSDSRKSGSFFHFRKNSNSSSEADKKKKEDGLALWLRDGTVIYKSVGLGLMDLVVGTHLIEVANEKKLGTHVEAF
ncbi:hypothetical protein AK830_g9088 [Neonectria ditissima]|uniref:Uncharacterized protein n=1 Tax=Neonectria ditissima TaxID=78410 RepID=A0A0P7B6F3_9HYPO|nr:hypothetical protein AK830_g9088 [Neonectria ditissima]